MDDPSRLKRMVRGLSGLPTLPDVVERLRLRLAGPQTTSREIAELVANDPAIAAMVLRAANSPFYGPPQRIASVSRAIATLGLHAVQGIVLNVTAFDEAPPGGFDRPAFWRHCLGVGLAARTIGRALGFTALEELFLAGLLHDAGTIVLDRHCPDGFGTALRRARREGLPLAEAERAALGATHAEVGAWLFEQWRLPRGLVDVARWHHAPAQAAENGNPAALVHVADALCEELRFGAGGGGRPPAVDEAAWEMLGLRPAQREGIRRDLEKACARAAGATEPVLA